jgi:predicted ribosome quality control (RQC) complex YloA/Tae2 family protein
VLEVARMPFDALMMRAVEARWKSRLAGALMTRVQCGRDRILWTVRTQDGQTDHLLWVLQPGLARVHRTSHATLANKIPTPPWLQKILPARIEAVEVPTLERVMHLKLTREDEWSQPLHEVLIVELAGHLTNLILTSADGLITDAWRRVGPGRPGRTIWPRLPYEPPPAPTSSAGGFDSAALPPWASRWLEAGGDRDRLESDWARGFPGGACRLTSRSGDDVWVYAMPGFEIQWDDDLERTVDRVYDQKEQQRLETQLKSQLLSQLQSRVSHLAQKVSDYDAAAEEDESLYKMRGDLWLAYQSQFPAQGPAEVTVDGFDGQPVELHLEEGKTPSDKAHDAYRRYKKIRARKEAVARLIPLFEKEKGELQALMQSVHQESHAPDWYRAQLKHTQRRAAEAGEKEPFRHFTSRHGLDIWVGRSRDENAALTFKKARPDDMWLHAKQAPGSHVVLACGRKDPDLEDLLDAAELAVFFSSASQSSTVPVDYTRRKFVRKRPHAEPGQVLYQRERTLYITPDGDRLRRLGAVSEKLLDERP